MRTTNDGGPAFPCTTGIDGGVFQVGMSLRDVFAIGPMSDEELETLVEAFKKKFPSEPISISRVRYYRADTMLETRRQWYDEHQPPTPLLEPDNHKNTPPEAAKAVFPEMQ